MAASRRACRPSWTTSLTCRWRAGLSDRKPWRERTRALGPDRVRHALLGETRLGSARELFLPCRGLAGRFSVLFALRHEALERRASQLLVGRLRLARGLGRESRRGAQSQTDDRSHHAHGWHSSLTP